jgi:hypothetical protein
MTDSPSQEPVTQSPNALLDGPVIQRAAAADPGGKITSKNGIVTFGK